MKFILTHWSCSIEGCPRRGPISLEELELEVDKALTPGQGNLVKVKETSIFLFAIGAGVAVFFSPCSFPLLPGYMTYYLSTKKRTSGTLDERTAREALPAGLAAASGVTGVLLLIGILLVPFVSLLGGILPLLELLVGLIIFALGVSMLLDYSLEPMLQPLRQGVAALGSTIGEFTQGRPTALAEKGIQRATGSDFSFAQSRQDGMGGLFLYGVGYGSAASGCMAPIVLGLLLASLERGIVTGLVVFLLFAVTTGLLMVAFTLLVASSEDTIVNKLRAYRLQDQGFDTVDANTRLGLPDEARDFPTAARMLDLLGIDTIRLMTNNPAKVRALEAEGVRVEERVPHALPDNPHNTDYLATKRDRSGHLL